MYLESIKQKYYILTTPTFYFDSSGRGKHVTQQWDGPLIHYHEPQYVFVGTDLTLSMPVYINGNQPHFHNLIITHRYTASLRVA
jgi:hypothetical protein